MNDQHADIENVMSIEPVKMENADGDLPVHRIEIEERYPIESETKSRTRGDIFLTSDKPRVDIPPCAPHVRQHAIVLFSAGDITIRQRALDMLKRLMNETEPNGALEVLQAFEASKKN